MGTSLLTRLNQKGLGVGGAFIARRLHQHELSPSFSTWITALTPSLLRNSSTRSRTLSTDAFLAATTCTTPNAAERVAQIVFAVLRHAEQEVRRRALDKGNGRDEDEPGNETRGERVPASPAEPAGQNCRDDNRRTAKGVCHDMQIDPVHVVVTMASTAADMAVATLFV